MIRKIAIVAFSEDGAGLARRLDALSGRGYETELYVSRRHCRDGSKEHAADYREEPFDNARELTTRLFYEADAIAFIGACGIAVRLVAPLVKSKLSDPAVVVCDETGRFAVSLLSGHAGGANNLAREIAGIVGADPVVTTASDLRTGTVGILGREKSLVLGIGCRSGLSAEEIDRAATIMLWDFRIPLHDVVAIATIDIKMGDRGLVGFAEAHGIPASYYSAKELAEAKGDFQFSSRVYEAVGVGNVCERAACLRSGGGRLIMPKRAKNGVAIAVYELADAESPSGVKRSSLKSAVDEETLA